jgi:GTPase SAR1 family protein
MGALCAKVSEEDAAAKKKSLEIDKELARDRRIIRDEVKLLLLGAGESGKSTIFKQMKILSLDGGFTREELNDYKFVVYGNCITQMKVLLNAAVKLNINVAKEENEERVQRILKLPTGGDPWTPEVGQDIAELWQDPGIQQVYQKRDKHYQLNDSAAYFFDNIPRFLKDDYQPSLDDVLRARIRTTGIEEAVFNFDDLSFRMVDVGGQRSERRKWIHCFDCVTAVIFCVATSEYDQTLREDDSKNRMKESLELFYELCNSPWFRNTAFILFLNKIDLFKEKIQRVDLNVVFPKYTGGLNYEKATTFIKERFLGLNESPHVIYPHFTCAINTENIEFVFKAVRETILRDLIDQRIF